MICTSPIRLTVPDSWIRVGLRYTPREKTIEVPCGKCIACQQYKSLEWTMRLSHEWIYYQGSTLFLTLTYDKEHCPEDYSLRYSDFQKFMKRLRINAKRKHNITDIKFFVSGEYGSRGRPHYHCILFGLPDEVRQTRKVYNKNFRIVSKIDQLIYDSWQQGEIMIGYASNLSFKYTANYIQKDQYGHLSEDYYKARFNRVKPFTRKSQGLGKRFCIDYAEHFCSGMSIQFQSSRMSIPRQYLKWLDNDELNERIRLKSQQRRAHEITELYNKNPHLQFIEPDRFSHPDMWYNISNHPELYKVMEAKRDAQDRSNYLRRQEWLSQRSFFTKALPDNVD